MKRWLMLLFALMLCLSAAAEDAQGTTILGYMTDDEYIHQYTAPNGQNIYFTARESDPYIRFQDVNFDGYEDIVILTLAGASNGYFEFFVYDVQMGEYYLAAHNGLEEGLANYQLHPENGLVSTYANNGYAGALFEKCIFCWENGNLKMIRWGVSDCLTENSYEENTTHYVTRHDVLHVTIRAYVPGVWGGEILLEETILLDDMATEMLDKIDDVLWQGIK